RVLHLPGHRLFQTLLESERRVDVQLGARDERGHEEWKALDVVPVRVADEEMQTQRLGKRLQQMEAELAGTGAAVEHDDRSVRRAKLDARGVAAVARGALTRRGDRAACTPEPDVHDAPRKP